MAIAAIANNEIGSSVRTKLNSVITYANGTIPDGQNIVLGTTTGTKIGTSTSQKLGFYNVTPIVQAQLSTGTGKTVDNVITALQNLGLVRQ